MPSSAKPRSSCASSSSSPEEQLLALGIQVFQAREKSPSPRAGEEEISPASAPPLLVGYESTRLEVEESIILPLQHPEIFQSVARLTRGDGTQNMPRAILFEGPPGVGKTTMARIIALETGIPMVYVPVENILSKFYGESAQNMAAIFDAAASFPRVILFLDEIDSLAGSRESGMFEATRRVLSVLLRKIDGFDSRNGILTIGATNRKEDLDRALLSRFDHVVLFPLPAGKERASIFSAYARHLSSADLVSLADASAGLSGRQIQDICEYTERRWARTLIARNEPPSPPPASLYLEITRMKGESEVQRKHTPSS